MDSTREKSSCLVTFQDLDQMFDHVTKRKGTVDSYIRKHILAPSDTYEAFQEFNSTYFDTLARAEQMAK